MTKIIQENHDHLVRLCAKHKVKSLEIFGSALDESRFKTSGSDIDFLVEFLPLEPVAHAKSYFGLLRELQELFKRSVDLVEAGAIKNPYFLQAINKERKQVYAA